MFQSLGGVESVSEPTRLGNFIFKDVPEAVQLVSAREGTRIHTAGSVLWPIPPLAEGPVRPPAKSLFNVLLLSPGGSQGSLKFTCHRRA